jgi:hypothetical protein
MSNWTAEEDRRLTTLVTHDPQDWPAIARHMTGRTPAEIAAHWRTCLNPVLIKGSFLETEDQLIISFVRAHGDQKFRDITELLPGRTAKQCRERWFNHLNPSIRKGPWTDEEDRIIFDIYQQHPRCWSLIAASLPGRTDNSVKNRFNSSISKRMEPDERGRPVLVPSKARHYRQKTVKRRPAKYALEREQRAFRPPPAQVPPVLRVAGEARPPVPVAITRSFLPYRHRMKLQREALAMGEAQLDPEASQ